MQGFVWCHHCAGPHEIETRFCPSTGKPMMKKTSKAPAIVERIGPGSVIDRKYRVMGLIGRGGHSIVYEALHITLGQSVALKFLAKEQDQKVLQRFEQEARLTAAISHPNICRSFDIGALESGTRFIVMERLRGETLHSLNFRRPKFPVALAVHITRQILAALEAAHTAHVVHRDIKPGNVFVETAPAGKPPNVKVLDFGIAKVVGLTSSIRTTVGHALGTVRYMSPEQVLGRTLDGRSDLFAVGVVLYEMLTSIRPFEAGTPPEIAASVLRDKPPPLRSVRPDVPVALEEIVDRALAKEAAGRFSSADEMRRALKPLKDLGVAHIPPSDPLPVLGEDEGSDDS